MNTEILHLLTWEDVQEIWLTTDRTLHSIPEEPGQWPEWAMNTSTRFTEALNRIRKENKTLPQVSERYKTLVSAAERATGYSLTSTREAINSLIRSIVAYRLVKEGYHYSEIGKAMRRNHSTISHYIKKVENMLSVPNSYKREMDIFNEFVRLVGD